jgi:hypothetical protein
MLVPLLLVLLFVPGFGGRRESLDGFSLGAASALGFTFAAVITDLASRLSDGLAPSRPFTNILTEALIRGIATPVLAAAATGLIGASIWVHKSEKGTASAGGRWIANPLVVLVSVIAVQVGLGFADQARLSDITLLVVHLAGTGVVLLALRIGLHHILLHEAHDVVVGPSTTCSQCYHVVPLMPFCPSCGVALAATTKRHRPRPGAVGAEAPGTGGVDEAVGPAPSAPSWPCLSPGITPTTPWVGFAVALGQPSPVNRAHHARLLAIFSAGLVAIMVALLLTAITKEPDTTPVPRCHLGGCPGLPYQASSQLLGSGTPEPPPDGSFASEDGLFSLGFFVPDILGRPTLTQSPSRLVLTFPSETLSNGTNTVHLGGGQILVGDVSGAALQGASPQQVVENIVSTNMPSASLAYEMPDALVGDVPGYGGVYDDDVNSASGEQIDYRVGLMAAIVDGVAIIVMAVGPDDPSFQSLPFLSHPSFFDLDLAINGGLDAITNSIRWRSQTFQP